MIVLGTVALDAVETPFGKRKNMLGGSASHFAMSARLFTSVDIVAIVGEDFPFRYVDFLKKQGINLDSLIRGRGKSFSWEGLYEGDLNTVKTIKTELGVLLDFKPRLTYAQRRIGQIFLANIDPDIQRYLLNQMCAPRLVGLDSMNYWIKHKPKPLIRLLKKVHIYVGNDQEARDLSGEHNLIMAAKRLRSFGPKMVLIKKGEHGAMLYSDEFIFSLPAYPVGKVIDPTGAGDTFAGGFMGYLAKTKRTDATTLKKAVVYGTIAASFNVEGFGLNRTAGLRLRNLEARLRGFKKTVLF